MTGMKREPGGATGIVIAVDERIPAVVPCDCDADNGAHSRSIFVGIKDRFALLKRRADDPDERATLTSRQQDHIRDQHNPASVATGMPDLLSLAESKFADRPSR